jgi:hypothetical protein
MTPITTFAQSVPISAEALLAVSNGLIALDRRMMVEIEELYERVKPADRSALGALTQPGSVLAQLTAECAVVLRDRCERATSNLADELQASHLINDATLELSDTTNRVYTRVEGVCAIWLMERAAEKLPRSSWPNFWRYFVWLGAQLQYIEDAFALVQTAASILIDGTTLHPDALRWLTVTGAEPELERYLRSSGRQRSRQIEGVKSAVSESISMMAAYCLKSAELSLDAGDVVVDSRFLDAGDLVQLAIYSQMRLRGGLFLSHRGPDSKKALIPAFMEQRDLVFLDVLRRPEQDTNRRFLWRSLAGARAMNAFVTPGYVSSQYCLKELEAWGLLRQVMVARRVDVEGRCFMIGQNSDIGELSPLTGWVRSCSEHVDVDTAIRATLGDLTGLGALGRLSRGSPARLAASDAFNAALISLREDLAARSPGDMPLDAQAVHSVSNVLDRAVAHLGRGPDSTLGRMWDQFRIEAGSALETAPQAAQTFDRCAKVIREIAENLSASELHRDSELPGLFIALAAVAELGAEIVRRCTSYERDVAVRASSELTKFGAVADHLADQLDAWFEAWGFSGLALEDPEIIRCAVLIALRPIDHEATQSTIRVDSTVSPNLSTCDVDDLDRLGFRRRNVHIILDGPLTAVQKASFMAALFNLTSRAYLLVDVHGGAALDTTIAVVALREFPHVAVASIDEFNLAAT